MKYEVIVSNIGTVYSGDRRILAEGQYRTYVRRSRESEGRAAGETVTLMVDGEIDSEYQGSLALDRDHNNEDYSGGFAKNH